MNNAVHYFWNCVICSTLSSQLLNSMELIVYVKFNTCVTFAGSYSTILMQYSHYELACLKI